MASGPTAELPGALSCWHLPASPASLSPWPHCGPKHAIVSAFVSAPGQPRARAELSGQLPGTLTAGSLGSEGPFESEVGQEPEGPDAWVGESSGGSPGQRDEDGTARSELRVCFYT